MEEEQETEKKNGGRRRRECELGANPVAVVFLTEAEDSVIDVVDVERGEGHAAAPDTERTIEII